MPFATYDDLAPRYDTTIGRFERWFLRGLRATTLNQIPKDGRVLELGAGTGRNFVYYSESARGVASEPSREMLRIARDKPRPTRVSLVQNSAEQMPFGAGSFDAAFATLVFCSVRSPTAAFAELRRVVKRGGSVVLLEHVRPAGPLGLVFDLMNLLTVPLFEDHMNRRTARMAEAAGLEVLHVQKSAWGIINLITCRV